MAEAGIKDVFETIRKYLAEFFKGKTINLQNYAEKHKGLDPDGRMTDEWLESEEKRLKDLKKDEKKWGDDEILRKIQNERYRRLLEGQYKNLKL